MYICICACTYMYAIVPIRSCTCTWTNMCVNVYVCTWPCMYVTICKVDYLRTWSFTYVIMYIHDHICAKLLLSTLRLSKSCFSLHSGCTTAAFAHAQWAPQRLQRMLRKSPSSFCLYSVSASAAFAHTQCRPQCFQAHSECDKVFRNIRGRLRRTLSMCQNRFIVCSGGAAADLAHTQRPPQWLLHMLSPRQSFVTPPILAESKNCFSKNIHLSIGKYSLERNLKLATKKFSFLCTFK